MKIETVNHGNVYGTGILYSFHCGNCGRDIGRDARECSFCGEKVENEETKTPNKLINLTRANSRFCN